MNESDDDDENIDIDSLETGSIDLREFARQHGINLAFTSNNEDEEMEDPEH